MTSFDLTLYLVTDRRIPKEGFETVVEEAIRGGVTLVQLREKEGDTGLLYERARRLKEVTDRYHIPLIIDDRIDIMLAVDAAGVHVGQSDMEALDVRKLLGPDKIIGVSAQTVEQAVLAEKHGADYLGVGAVFQTNSKDDADFVSYDTLKAICEAVSIPVVAIGGITKDNIISLKDSGICGISVISAIFAEKDITAATKVLKERTLEMLGGKSLGSC